MKQPGKRAFTLIELLVVIGIIVLLTAVILTNVQKSRSYGRDAQVGTDKATIELAIARASANDANDKYPGNANTWYCLKTSGSCFRSGASADATVNSKLLPYMPGGAYPIPPTSKSGELRYDSYVYTPSNSALISGYTGPFLLWWQEKPILTADCNGYYAGQVDTGVYYCYEKLVK